MSISGYCHPRPLQCWNAHVSGETWPTETLSQKQSARVPLATLKERAGQGLKSCLSNALLLATLEEGGGGGLRRIHALSLQHWGRGHGASEEYIEQKSGHSCSSSIFHSRVHVPCRLQIIQVNIGEGGSTKSVAQRCSDIDLHKDDLVRFHCSFKRLITTRVLGCVNTRSNCWFIVHACIQFS